MRGPYPIDGHRKIRIARARHRPPQYYRGGWCVAELSVSEHRRRRGSDLSDSGGACPNTGRGPRPRPAGRVRPAAELKVPEDALLGHADWAAIRRL
jgi:hypothetical protein